MRLSELPGWVTDEVTSVREEVSRYRDMDAAELWRLTEDCARDALWAARASGILDRVLAHRDPLPASTVAALARLRERRD